MEAASSLLSLVFRRPRYSWLCGFAARLWSLAFFPADFRKKRRDCSRFAKLIVKPRPIERNNWTQLIPTLLDATCCVRLPTLLRRVATCWVLKIKLVRMSGRNVVLRTWPNNYNTMQHAQMLHEKFDHFQIWTKNTRNMSTQMHATCCSQQCWIMLRWNVAIVWLGLQRQFQRYFFILNTFNLLLVM